MTGAIEALIEAAQKNAQDLHRAARSDAHEAGAAVTLAHATRWDELAARAREELEAIRGGSSAAEHGVSGAGVAGDESCSPLQPNKGSSS